MGNLGYAVTAHRAQGVTVDTAHTLVEATTTREVLYVSMTRGRYSNHAYVATDKLDPAHSIAQPGENLDATARTILEGVLQHVGAEMSAHETITAEHDLWGGTAQLVAEYETIAGAAQQDRWAQLLGASGLTTEQVAEAVGAETFGALAAALRRAEAEGHPVDRLMPRLVQARGFADADDIASVLHYRLERAVSRTAPGNGSARPRLIVGLIPEAAGRLNGEMQEALDERRRLIESRAGTLLEAAIASSAPWVQEAGEPPQKTNAQRRWHVQLLTVTAYRDRHGIATSEALGSKPEGTAQRIDYERAQAALTRAQQIAVEEQQTTEYRRPQGRERRGPSR